MGSRRRASTGPVLDKQAYADLVKPSKAVAPFTYRAVAPDLFSSIVNAGMRHARIHLDSSIRRHRGQNDESPW